MKKTQGVMLWGCLAASGLSVGCDQAVMPPAEPEAIEVTNRELTASLTLSPTHKITFWDYGDGDAMIDEVLNVDSDKNAPVRLADMDMKGRSLTDAYLTLAGKLAETSAIDKLRALDGRVADRAKRTQITPEMEQLMAADAEKADYSTVATKPAAPISTKAPEGVEVRTGAAACAEPSWDWQSDDGWFKNNFCGADSVFCATEFVWASYGWYRGPTWFKATGFAQSHCSSASWLMQRKNYAGFPSYGVTLFTLANQTLAPRTLNTQEWTTTGDRSWFAKVASTTGENRVALAIHRN
jgi:hypothetical protein